MSDSVLHHLTDRAARKPQEAVDEAEATDDYGAFGWLRGVRERAIFLEFRRKDGSVSALPYFMLERIDFDPSEGITLEFTNQAVRIVGRNLNAEIRPNVQLLGGLLRQRVPWIKEADQATNIARDKQAVVVEQIFLE